MSVLCGIVLRVSTTVGFSSFSGSGIGGNACLLQLCREIGLPDTFSAQNKGPLLHFR